MKRHMLEHWIDRTIFYSLYGDAGQFSVGISSIDDDYDDKIVSDTETLLRKVPLLLLLRAFIVSQAESIAFALIFLNFAMGASIINLVLPVSMLFYAMLENPFPSYKYWRFVSVYILMAIAAKLSIQLPVFCSTPAFAVASCNEEI